MNNKVNIRYAQTLEEAINYEKEGYEPVECSFGKHSVVGKLLLDHHGQYSGQDAVSIKAAKFALNGIKLKNFVVTGEADCDQCYAIAALSGPQIPVKIEHAEAIAEIDTDPVGRDKTNERYIQTLMFEQKTQNLKYCLESSYKSLDELIRIYNNHYDSNEVNQAINNERERKISAKNNIKLYEQGKIALAVSQDKGFDVWYEIAPVVVHYNPDKKLIVFMLNPKKGGLFGEKTGFDLLGKEGLIPIYEKLDNLLQKKGCGGREMIGGSPRNVEMSYNDALRAYEFIKSIIV